MNSEKVDKVGNWLKGEAVLIAGATTALYIFTFFFQKSYLAYFLIDEVFISIGAKTVLASAAWLLGTLMSSWYLFGIVPYSFLKSGPKIFLVYHNQIILAAVAGLAFYALGFVWLTVALFLVLFAFALSAALTFLRFRKKGGTFAGFIDLNLKAEVEWRKGSASQTLVRKLDWPSFYFLTAFFVAPYAAGSISGSMSAALKGDFQSIEVDSEIMIFVSHADVGSIAVIGEHLPDSRTFTLKGQAKIIPSDAFPQDRLTLLKGMRIKKPESKSGQRQSASKFLEKVQADLVTLYSKF
ncbi:hypothetical protein [Limimaricola sp. AA108-03]|uniref:hypothetical protein n=1 Tax=Limimaricola sp. AA108-03 TaxID=3425945 RepID=UPI003D7899BC